MLIKNVSTRIVSLEDFPEERPIVPGGVVDLSKYPVTQRETSNQLKNLFTKGDLLCLGRAAVDPKLQQAQITKVALGKYDIKPPTLSEQEVIIPASKLRPEVGIVSRNRQDSLVKPGTVPERYNTAALDKYRVETEQMQEGEIPAFAERDFEPEPGHSFVQIQDEGEVYTVQVDPVTGVKYSTPFTSTASATPKELDSSVFVDKLVYKSGDEEDLVRTELRRQLREKINAKIVQRVESKCYATKIDGRPCERTVIAGFKTCVQHMSPIDRLRYMEQKKKVPTRDNKKDSQ